jgi:dTMP kinase
MSNMQCIGFLERNGKCLAPVGRRAGRAGTTKCESAGTRGLFFARYNAFAEFGSRRLSILDLSAIAMFFSFDGMDGVGKSTQIGLFCDWLRESGREVVVCRDPGSTPLGESVRQLLLDSHGAAICRPAEMFLYMAARAQLVAESIAPALAAGKTVVCDRFLLANVVYQGHAGGLDPKKIWEVGQIATGGLQPDLTFVLDMPESEAAGRLQRELDRMEQQGDAFRTAVRRGFLEEAARSSGKIVVVDAARSIDAVQADIRAAAERVLKGSQP